MYISIKNSILNLLVVHPSAIKSKQKTFCFPALLPYLPTNTNNKEDPQDRSSNHTSTNENVSIPSHH